MTSISVNGARLFSTGPKMQGCTCPYAPYVIVIGNPNFSCGFNLIKISRFDFANSSNSISVKFGKKSFYCIFEFLQSFGFTSIMDKRITVIGYSYMHLAWTGLGWPLQIKRLFVNQATYAQPFQYGLERISFRIHMTETSFLTIRNGQCEQVNCS